MFFQQRERRLFTLPGSQNPNQTDYILAAEDGKALYSQEKQDLELIVAEIISSLMQNSGSD